MVINHSKPPETVIELNGSEVLTLSSTYESLKFKFKKADYRSVKLKVYDNMLEVECAPKDGLRKSVSAFSDHWDFTVQ